MQLLNAFAALLLLLPTRTAEQVHGNEAAKPPTWRQLPGLLAEALCNKALLYFSFMGLLWMFCMSSLYSWLPLIVANILSGTALAGNSTGTNAITAQGSSANSCSSIQDAAAAAACAAAASKLTTNALLLITPPYMTAGAATVVVAWLASRPPSHSRNKRKCSVSGDQAACAVPDRREQQCHPQPLQQQQRATRMFHVAVPLLIGAVPLLCFAPAYTAHPLAGFAMLWVALTAGFATFSPLAAEASKTVPASTAGVGLSVFNLVAAIGGVVGPAAVGALVQASGGFKWAVFMLGGVMAVSSMVAAARGMFECMSGTSTAAAGGVEQQHKDLFDTELGLSVELSKVPCRRVSSLFEGVVVVLPQPSVTGMVVAEV